MVFDVCLCSKSQIKRNFSPSGANSVTWDDLAANMVDVVALQGTLSGRKETMAHDRTHQVAEAMREVLAQARGKALGGWVKGDHGWQSQRRVLLNGIKSAEQLQKQYTCLLYIGEEVLSHFVQSTLAIL